MNGLVERWQKLSKREQRIVLILVLVVGGVLFYQGVHRPQWSQWKRARSERFSLQSQLAAFKLQLPDLKKGKQIIDEEVERTKELEQELEVLKASLPTVGELGTLLAELAKQGENLNISFESIRQELEESSEKPSVMIEIAMFAPYDDLVNYIKRVEQLSPFLTVRRLTIAEPDKAKKEKGNVRLELTTPLRLSQEGSGLTPVKEEIPKVEILRNPFASTKLAEETQKRDDLKLMGITLSGPSSTAIINNEVVRVGEAVENLKVKEILSNMVVLDEDGKSVVVVLEQHK